jgi:hypothetical protein
VRERGGWVVSASPPFSVSGIRVFGGIDRWSGRVAGLTHDISLDGVVGETSTDGLSGCGSMVEKVAGVNDITLREME